MKLTPVPKITNINSDDFLNNYMKPCKPVILEDFADPNSPAFTKWNYDYFKEIAGDILVNVYGNETQSHDKVASEPIAKTAFSDYLDLIASKSTDHRLFLFNLLNIKPELKNDIQYKDITKGKILKWLPFVFFGGEGSVTRNHVDIDMSHVFMIQFQGIKKIWLFPWEQSDLLYKLPYNFHSVVNLKEADYEKYPGTEYLNGYEVIIKPGETLYIPSGWWHYIQYETQGYSVSVRALPSSALQKWRGFKNLFITRHFDNAMRIIFKEKWFHYKIKTAHERAEKAINEIHNHGFCEDENVDYFIF
ncbi:cupin-like domain-containing protein [Chryseobacterium chendengshani]|uniref:cupin-like domain-containing protein n=1 Tax=Chryseobacterium sp. LJ668 TaxID=2864040 RepID=UPI001C692ED9|nr:cupin-like domain-containing protein [Chryseobacterium sp. LJ668]MBW8523102.1 cupin-like domain-containing protein [Chryseobacterium sp. LJ668]QYK16629.1 cupin-like domain-containing protein [Chryseobacterium sp. LJ668]